MAVLDALGFRGIWKRRDAKAVLDRMKSISTESKRLAEEVWTSDYQNREFGAWKAKDIVRLETKVVHFSDSVIVCCESKPGPAFAHRPHEQLRFGTSLELFSLNYLAFALSMIVAEGASEEPRFLYRGAVAAGSFWFEEPSSILGEAIDEAAASERMAEAAVVHYCESARRIFDDSQLWCPAVVKDYPVPVKGERTIRTHVVNPFATFPLVARTLHPTHVRECTHKAIVALSAGILGFMDSEDSDVQAKRRNTEHFLRAAAAQIFFAPHDT
ncbi:MAG: hypothetical protein ACHQ9S_16885 [Candidatus Binatia bacterium]